MEGIQRAFINIAIVRAAWAVFFIPYLLSRPVRRSVPERLYAPATIVRFSSGQFATGWLPPKRADGTHPTGPARLTFQTIPRHGQHLVFRDLVDARVRCRVKRIDAGQKLAEPKGNHNEKETTSPFYGLGIPSFVFALNFRFAVSRLPRTLVSIALINVIMVLVVCPCLSEYSGSFVIRIECEIEPSSSVQLLVSIFLNCNDLPAE